MELKKSIPVVIKPGYIADRSPVHQRGQHMEKAQTHKHKPSHLILTAKIDLPVGPWEETYTGMGPL